jgi:uncharacterized protein YerC
MPFEDAVLKANTHGLGRKRTNKAQEAQVLELRRANKFHREIAAIVGLSIGTVSRICNRNFEYGYGTGWAYCI